MDANVGDRAADEEGVYPPEPQQMIQMRTVEGIVADLADYELVLAWLELVHYLPTPRAFPDVLWPDIPLRVAVVVGAWV